MKTIAPLEVAPSKKRLPSLAQKHWPKNLIHIAKKLRKNSCDDDNPRMLQETMGSLRRSIVLSSLKKVPTINRVNQDNDSPARQVYGLNKIVPIDAKKSNRVQLPQLNSFATSTVDSSNQDQIYSAKKDAGSVIFGQTSSSHRKLLSITSRTDGQNMNINDHFKL